MIVVSPMKDIEEVKQRFDHCRIAYTDGCMSVQAIEDGAPVGFGLFTLAERELTLLYVDYPESDPAVCDLITRAVMNYGVNRGALECEIGPMAPKKALVALGFIPDETAVSMNIVYVFTHCTHCRGGQKEI